MYILKMVKQFLLLSIINKNRMFVIKILFKFNKQLYIKNIYMYMMIIEKNNLKKLIMSAKIFKNTTKKKEEKVL